MILELHKFYIRKNTIRDGGSIALYTAGTVYTMYTVNTVYTVQATLHCLNISSSMYANTYC